MEPAKVEVGTLWTHRRTGNHYEVLELVKVKDADGANWSDGVKYIPLDNPTSVCYVRFFSNFLSAFTPKETQSGSSAKDVRGGADGWFEPGKD